MVVALHMEIGMPWRKGSRFTQEEFCDLYRADGRYFRVPRLTNEE
jgi:hypothetical protein